MDPALFHKKHLSAAPPSGARGANASPAASFTEFPLSDIDAERAERPRSLAKHRVVWGAACAPAIAIALLWAAPAWVGRRDDARPINGRKRTQPATTLTIPAGAHSEISAGIAPGAPPLSRSEPSSEEPVQPPAALNSDGQLSEKSPGDPEHHPSECRSTPLTPVGLASALYEGYITQFGEPPRIERLACAWAQCALENARGAIIYENNIGNVTTPDGRRSCSKRIHERVSKSPEQWALRTMRFRAFDTPAAGAAAYWKLLATSYNSVLARCDAADPRGAAGRLSELGYFTGASEPYAVGMERLFAYANQKLRGPSFLAPNSL